MRVGLIDVDSAKPHGRTFPNLALMKLSSYHKSMGDIVQWYRHDDGVKYDRVYQSKVFTFTPDIDYAPRCIDIRKGGTGYSLEGHLPDRIEHIYPDYGLYGISDTAYGFLSRGCPRGCDFCIVAKKEGRKSVKVANLCEWWRWQSNIELLDPNILACADWEDLLCQLAFSHANVNINQGADIRLVTQDKIAALNRIKLTNIHFAWDNTDDDLRDKFELYAQYARRKYHGAWASVYVLTNFNSTIEQDLYRIEELRKLKYDPYVMIYDKEHAPRTVRHLARWCNNRFVFKSCTFKQYLKTRAD